MVPLFTTLTNMEIKDHGRLRFTCHWLTMRVCTTSKSCRGQMTNLRNRTFILNTSSKNLCLRTSRRKIKVLESCILSQTHRRTLISKGASLNHQRRISNLLMIMIKAGCTSSLAETVKIPSTWTSLTLSASTRLSPLA